MRGLLTFLSSLEKQKTAYRLEHNRKDSIMVLIAVPGERWEVEFFADDRIEVEVFGKSPGVHSLTLDELLDRFKE